MDPPEAAARLSERIPAPLLVSSDDDSGVRVYLRRDMLHLDADELHDRLHHWTLHELQPRHEGLSAHLSFQNARPAAPHEDAELDLQERYLGLEPMLRLDLRDTRDPERSLDAMAQLAPRFLELVQASGRPGGFRRVDMGSME